MAFDPDAYLKESAAPQATPAKSGFDPDSYLKESAAKLADDDSFDPVAHAAQNPDDAEFAFSAYKAKQDQPFTRKVARAFSDPLETGKNALKGVGNFLYGLYQTPRDAVVQTYYSATGNPDAKTKQAEATLAAQHGEESVKSAGSAILNTLVPPGMNAGEGDPSTLTPEEFREQVEAVRRDEFNSKVKAHKRQTQLANGIPLDDGAIASIYSAGGLKPSEEVGPQALADAGAAPVDLDAVAAKASASDPMMLALSAAPMLPGAKYVGGKLVQGTGKVLQLPMQALEHAPGKLGRAANAAGAGAGVVVAETALHNPALAAKIAGGLMAGKGLQKIGRAIEMQGKEAATGVPSRISERVAKGRLEAARGGSRDWAAEVARPIGEFGVDAAATAAAMAPVNAAMSEGDPGKFVESEVGAAAFGSVLGAMHSARPALVEALRPSLRADGLSSMDTTTELGQRNSAYVQSLPEGERNRILETMGAVQGLNTQGEGGGKGTAQFYIVDNATYLAELGKLTGSAPTDGGRGFFIGENGKAIINGDYAGADTTHTIGHEGAHMARAILAASGEKGSSAWDSMVKEVSAGVMKNGKPSKEFADFIKSYNESFDPSGKTQRLDASNPEALEEFLAEHAGRIIATEGAEFALPKTLFDKIHQGLGRYMMKAIGVDAGKIGVQTSHLNEAEFGEATRLMRDTFAQIAQMPREAAPDVTIPDPSLNTPAAAPVPAATPAAAPIPPASAAPAPAPVVPAPAAAPIPARPADAAPITPAPADRLAEITAELAQHEATRGPIFDDQGRVTRALSNEESDLLDEHEALVLAHPEPESTPPESSTGAPEAFSDLAKGATADLYEKLFDKLKKGDLTEAGYPSPVLAAAKPLMDAGLINNAQELKEWVQNGQKPLPGASPASETPSPAPNTPKETPAQSGGQLSSIPVAPEVPEPAPKGQLDRMGETPGLAKPREGTVAVETPKVTREQVNQLLKEVEEATTEAQKGARRKNDASREKQTKIAVKQARIRALLDLATQGAESDSHLQRREEYGKEKFTGRLDPENEIHNALLDEMGISGAARSNIATLEENLGKMVFVTYKAPGKEVQSETSGDERNIDRTGKQRAKEIAAERPDDRKANEDMGLEHDKAFYPLGFRVNPGTGSVTVTGFSPQKFLSNAAKIIKHLEGKKQDARYKGPADPQIAKDMKGYAENHANGYKGDGSGPLQMEGVETNPNYQPYSIPSTRFELLNAALGNESAKTPRRGNDLKSQEAQGIARDNSGFLTEEGETNALRDQLNKSGDFVFHNENGESRTGTKEILEETVESLRVDPELMRKISTEAPEHENSIRSTGVVDPSEIVASGIPKNKAVAAGFMPGKEGGQLSDFEDKTTSSIKSKMEKEGQLAKFMPRAKKQEEEPKNLLGVHNLSLANLKHAIQVGGLPVPSLAVIRTDKSNFDSFGEVTLIAPKDLIDPKRNKDSKIFNADVYSPRYPEVNVKLKEGDGRKVVDLLKPYYEELGSPDDYTWKPFRVVENLTERGYREIRHNALVNYALAREKGLVEAPEKGEDAYKMRSRVSQALEGHEQDASDWLRNKMDEMGVVPEERIFDGFTASGKRRYLPHDLDTVVRIMKKSLRNGEGFGYGVGSIRSKVAKQFKSLEGIQKERDSVIPKKDFEKVKEEINKEYSELESEHGRGVAFDDDLIALAEGGRSNMEYLKGQYPNGIPQPMRDFLEKLKNLPTEYFESKIQRAVQLQEFAGAVVPDSTPADVIKRLEKSGLTVETYKEGDSEARKAAIDKIGGESQSKFMPGGKKGQLSGFEGQIPPKERQKNFKKWTGKATVIKSGDSIEDLKPGRPVVIEGFHGTTHGFEVIDTSRANIENDLGKGFYLTNKATDADSNYAGEGPDLTSRIERKSERLEQEERDALIEEHGLTEEEADLIESSPKYGTPEYEKRQQILYNAAKKTLTSHGGATMKVFVKLEKPLKLGGKEEYWDAEYDEDTGEVTGKMAQFMEALRDEASNYDEAEFEEGGRLDDMAMEGGRPSDVIQAAKEAIPYATDPETGDVATSEIIRAAIERMGYDGIIDATVNEKFGSARKQGKQMEGIDEETFHVIAFRSDQIKSATGNSGAFDLKNPNINFMPGEKGQLGDFGEETPSSIKPKVKPAAEEPYGKFRLRQLPRDMREELFNDHATYVDQEATEENFYSKRVPIGMLNLEGIKIDNIPDSQMKSYLDANYAELPPVVIADGKLMDGQHRIQAARKKGIKKIRYIDLTGILDTSESGGGYISKLPGTDSSKAMPGEESASSIKSKIEDSDSMPGSSKTWFIRDGKRVYHQRGEDGQFKPKRALASFVAMGIAKNADDKRKKKLQLENLK